MDEQIAVLAVADKGSFEAAGKYLGVGRSAVRKKVQSVENELAASIFLFFPHQGNGANGSWKSLFATGA